MQAGDAAGRHMITVIEYDFAGRRDRPIPVAEVPASRQAGRFLWVDAEAPTEAEIEELFRTFPVNADARTEILGPDREGRFDAYDDALHFAMTEARFAAGELATAHVDAVMTASFLLTFHRRETEFIPRMRRTVHEDFVAYSQSPGFLLYELGDHLLDQYRRTLHAVSDAVEGVQQRLFGRVDDGIFRDVAVLASDIGGLRKVLLGARELMHELSSRRSPYVSETTQPFLGRMAGTLERLDGDLNSERQLLNETLNLYLGMVGHRTNKIVNRLTLISIVFLPLTFLCGVYGMNFANIPETQWRYGYAYFWLLALGIVGGLIWLIRRLRWM